MGPCLLSRGPHSYAVNKVKSYATEAHLDSGVASAWTRHGNGLSDRAQFCPYHYFCFGAQNYHVYLLTSGT